MYNIGDLGDGVCWESWEEEDDWFTLDDDAHRSLAEIFKDFLAESPHFRLDLSG